MLFDLRASPREAAVLRRLPANHPGADAFSSRLLDEGIKTATTHTKTFILHEAPGCCTASQGEHRMRLLRLLALVGELDLHAAILNSPFNSFVGRNGVLVTHGNDIKLARVSPFADEI